jgi:hypothetical protein
MTTKISAQNNFLLNSTKDSKRKFRFIKDSTISNNSDNTPNIKEIRDELASLEIKIIKFLKPRDLIGTRGYSSSDYLQHCIDISKNIHWYLRFSRSS